MELFEQFSSVADLRSTVTKMAKFATQLRGGFEYPGKNLVPEHKDVCNVAHTNDVELMEVGVQ